LHAIEIAVEIDLQERRGMIGGPPRRGGLNALEAKRSKVQFVNEGFNDPDRVIIVT
jgi:hypothetical protein